MEVVGSGRNQLFLLLEIKEKALLFTTNNFKKMMKESRTPPQN